MSAWLLLSVFVVILGSTLLTTIPAYGGSQLLSLEFDSLDYEGIRLSQVDIDIEHGQADSFPTTVSVGELQLSRQHFSDILLTCTAILDESGLACDNGNIRLRHADFGQYSGQANFRYDLQQGLESLQLHHMKIAGGRLDLSVTGPAPDWDIKADIESLELDQARQFVALFNENLSLETLTGKISGTLQARGWPLESTQINMEFADINYAADSVLQSLSGDMVFSLVNDNNEWQGELKLIADSGEMYLVPPLSGMDPPPGFYIPVGDSQLALEAFFGYDNNTSRLVIQDLNYDHPGVLQLNLAARLQLKPEISIDGLSLRTAETALEKAYPVYIQPLMISTPYNDLEVSGMAAIEAGLSNAAISAVSLQMDKVDVVDNSDRFAVFALTTDIQMTRERQHSSRVTWESIDIYRIGLGSGAIRLASDGLNIEVTEWQDVPFMDGTLRISELDLHEVGKPEFELHMAGTIESVSLPVMTEAIGWPTLGGTLDGEFTGLTYTNGDINMDGELHVRMFDGHVTITHLNVRDLFGSLPVLTADIGVEDIDLEQLTGTFAFGKITGGLGGYIHDLKLENWQPVAFDARLSTLDDGDTRHRISQKALNNLSQIGGGLRGALSRGFLSYFDEYSYGELGLSCRLANGYCELGGVETYEEGHYLLTRGGLLPPWVEVKLAGSIIAWDALIEGFEQIAQGEVKID